MQMQRVARSIGPSIWLAVAALTAAVVVLMQFMAVLRDAVARGAKPLPQQTARGAERADRDAVGVVNWVIEAQPQRVSRKTGPSTAVTRL